MKAINVEFHNLACAETRIDTKEFFKTLLSIERQVFEDGLYKNGPTVIETNLSTFGQQGTYDYKFYVPVNAQVDANEDFTYVKHLVLNNIYANRVPFDENFRDSLNHLSEALEEDGLKQKGDKIYLVMFPVYKDYFVDIMLPFEGE
ncbi:hypothetical protein [Streptococcus loxodontisalivarius]|uniref:DUF5085 family protein n=1 Tax=Streptococcus loxodontisalivarius TaxID=1349415 RepID=A0ABS2PRV4_9STRE|nr:hypothetical protein [Streptococcus loxodontisalivarius]MBM7642766.1 hypothetical protein [Streptococcus loxodontisalivarius]